MIFLARLSPLAITLKVRYVMPKLKINSTHLNNTVLLNILKGCRQAQKTGISHIENRHGVAIISVRKYVKDKKVMFLLKDQTGENINRSVYKKIFDSNINFSFSLISFTNRLMYDYDLVKAKRA